jgi:Tol biopolymer transport system component
MWSADGQTIGFVSDRTGVRSLFQTRSDGLGTPELVLDIEEPVNDAEWSRSGEWLVYRTGRGATGDVYAQRFTGDAVTVTVADDPGIREHSVTLSPNERWVAYVSDEAGRNEVYVRSFPDVDQAKRQVSIGGGSMPHWAHGGTELFFKGGDSLMAVDVVTEAESFSVGRPRALFSLEGYHIPGRLETFNVTYDVASDDQRFLLLKEPPATEPDDVLAPALVLVENFAEELKRLVPKN